MEDHSKSLARSTFQFLSGTFISRITGLIREVIMAFLFGASPALAGFFIAYRFSNLIRRLFGDGAMLAGFSPHFEIARAQSTQTAITFFRDLLASLSFMLIILLSLLEGALIACWKWGAISPDTKEILFLSILMLPGVFFICLYALFSALLQSEKRYFLPGIAPVAFNLMIIATLILIKGKGETEAFQYLSVSVAFAFFFQWMMVVPAAIKILKPYLTWKQWLHFKLFPPAVCQMAKAITYTVLGMGAVQINTALDSVFARTASLSGPAYLNYAMRLYQVPLALFGIAMGAALLPPLSRAMQQKDIPHYRNLLSYALSRAFTVMCPTTVGVFVLGMAAISMIYGHGDFSEAAVTNTTRCLWAYSLGLIPSVFVLLLSPAFYAKRDYRTPLKASLLSVVVNCLLNYLFIHKCGWGSESVALATSFASFLNCYYLYRKIRPQMGPIFDPGLTKQWFKVVAVSLSSGLIALIAGRYAFNDISVEVLLNLTIKSPKLEFLKQILHLFEMTCIYLGISFLLMWIFDVSDFRQKFYIKKERE
jgi:putative peptidoglycan lipid II flippase